MRMSDDKKESLFQAIAEPIMDLRIELQKHPQKDIDTRLYQLELGIWQRVFKVLELKGTP